MVSTSRKIRFVFEHYDIVSEGDLEEAVRRLENARVPKQLPF